MLMWRSRRRYSRAHPLLPFAVAHRRITTRPVSPENHPFNTAKSKVRGTLALSYAYYGAGQDEKIKPSAHMLPHSPYRSHLYN